MKLEIKQNGNGALSADRTYGSHLAHIQIGNKIEPRHKLKILVQILRVFGQQIDCISNETYFAICILHINFVDKIRHVASGMFILFK